MSFDAGREAHNDLALTRGIHAMPPLALSHLHWHPLRSALGFQLVKLQFFSAGRLSENLYFASGRQDSGCCGWFCFV